MSALPGEGHLDQLQRRRDGRNVDLEIGALAGEGAQQRVEPGARAFRDAFPDGYALGVRPSEAGVSEPAPSYYGLPVLKEAVWIWSIPAYFHVGGVAGTSALLGAVADFTARRRLERLSRACHWVSAVGDVLSAGLLIHDLGRPERFLNMLRTFRPTSPMSIGSWVLAACGAASGGTIVLRNQRGPLLRHLRKLASGASGLMGIPLAGYTAVLLSNSAVPVWQGTRRTLPLLFMSSAAGSAGALLQLFPLRPVEHEVLQRYAVVGLTGSLVASVAVEREAARSEVVVRPLRRGPTGALWRGAQACTAAALALSLGTGRTRTRAAGVLATVGGLAMRFAVFHAGKASARDPQATFQSQREGLGAAEVMAPSKVLRDSQPERFPLPVVR